MIFRAILLMMGVGYAMAVESCAFSPAATPHAVAAVGNAVATWQITHPSPHEPLRWTVATWYLGLDTWLQTSGNPAWQGYLAKIGTENNWKAAARPGHADDHAILQTWLRLYERDRIPAQLAPALAVMKTFTAHEPGNLEWKQKPSPTLRDWAWCDSLFMAPPVLAQLATVTGDTKWLADLDRFWWYTSDYLFDPTENLYFRDSTFFKKKETNGKKVFWGRGNGWVFAGLVHVLQNMPLDHPTRPRYVAQFQQMGKRLTELQTADGTWHASLLDPDSFPAPETSGTAFYTYGLLWGVDQGLLPATCLSAAHKAWSAMVKHIHSDGMVGFVQPIGDSPKAVTFDSNDVYGPGGFLLAASQMLIHLTIDGAVRGPLAVRNDLAQVRLGEVASIPWVTACARIPGLSATNVAVRSAQTGRLVPIQVFDAEGDGQPDELLFLANVMPKAVASFELLKLSGAQLPALPSRLHARFVPERKDDFAWENDRNAYRTYGPAIAKEGTRDGIDVWTKRTRELVIDRWYQSGKYHEDHGEGCDCYQVGDTLGCGGFGYLDAQGKITTSSPFATATLICPGPLRLVFALKYPEYQVADAKISETKRISMDLGDDVFRVDASWVTSGPLHGISGVAGMRARPEAKVPVDVGNVVTTFVDAEGGEVTNGQIGQGLILPAGVTPVADHGHVYGIVTKDFAQPVTWYVGAAWSKGFDLATPESWSSRMSAIAARKASPLVAVVAE